MSSDGKSEHTLHKKMMNLKTADEDPHVLSIPPDVQNMILSHLVWEELLQMRATNSYYRDKISNDCQDIWNSRIAMMWTYGKGNNNNREFIKWSQENNFNVHRVNTETTGFQEFVRRRRLDHSVFDRLGKVDFGPKGEDRRVVVGGMVRRMKGLDECIDNHNWITLMEAGEDIIDCLKSTHAIAFLDDFSKDPQSPLIEQIQASWSLRETITYFGKLKESICHRPGCDTKQIFIYCQRVMNGIHRLHAYQQWKFLHAKKPVTHPIETGALVIAKFYLTICRTIKAYGNNPSDPYPDCYLFTNIDDEVDQGLCELAEDIKSGLEKRLENCANYPLLEVILEMQSLFGDDSPLKFKGNTANYYDPMNSLLHEVLKKKTGIPITLAIVYTAIVRRVCGAHLNLIGLPGHIVIGLPFEEDASYADRVYVDVFHGGKHLSHSDLKSIVAQYGLAWNDEMAKPISHQLVWERMIRNLMHCHSDVSMLNNDDVRVLMTLQGLIDPRMRVETFQEMILAPGFSAYTC